MRETQWHWRPEGPAENNPLFLWPLDLRGAVNWYVSNWKPFSEYFTFAVLACLSWFVLQPDLYAINAAGPNLPTALWLSSVYGRNLLYTLLFAGGFHLYFYTFRMQGMDFKYEERDPTETSTRFTFGQQVYDNMFWTLLSGVTIWTCYEAVLLWALASGTAPWSDWNSNPVWFAAWFLFIPLWLSLHFYLGHRLLHWKPLYLIAHAVHHRNVRTGPWSGLSMHPIEHAIYLSSVFIHFFVPSHPIHIFFHLYCLTLSAIYGHVGYDRLRIGKRVQIAIGHFHHQLHHRHFECNYGAAELPCDAWFNSFDDGSAEARERLRAKRYQR